MFMPNRSDNQEKGRLVKTKFWSDPYVRKLDPEGKLLYLYLFTNYKVLIFGGMELTMEDIVLETGINVRKVGRILRKLEQNRKIVRKKDWILLPNFIRHQRPNPSILQGIHNALEGDIPEWVREQTAPRLALIKEKEKEKEKKKTQKEKEEKTKGVGSTSASLAPLAPLASASDIRHQRGDKKSNEEFLAGLKKDPRYSGLDLDVELARAIAWATGKGRSGVTQENFLSWLSKCELPLERPEGVDPNGRQDDATKNGITRRPNGAAAAVGAKRSNLQIARERDWSEFEGLDPVEAFNPDHPKRRTGS
jgi:hypothetical protein